MTKRVSEDRIAEIESGAKQADWINVRSVELLSILADRADMEAANARLDGLNEKLTNDFNILLLQNSKIDDASAAKDAEIEALKADVITFYNCMTAENNGLRAQLATANKRIAELEQKLLDMAVIYDIRS